eukprot:8728517-Pyramimonas_sp.AAC.1
MFFLSLPDWSKTFDCARPAGPLLRHCRVLPAMLDMVSATFKARKFVFKGGAAPSSRKTQQA